MTAPALRSVTVLTHSRPQQIAKTLERLIADAREAGVLLRFDCDETAKLGLRPSEHVVCDAEPSLDVELCIVLGGDGTILKALRLYARTRVPVFAVNFGEVGFLATVEPEDLDDGRLHGRLRARLRGAAAARDHDSDGSPAAHRDQRHLVSPPGRRARRAARVWGRGLGGGLGALRRARRLHGGRIDGLQPRQRRAGHGLGGGGLRRVVHRPALAHRARLGGRAGRRAERLQPRPRGGRRHVDGRPACQIDPGDTLVTRYEAEAARLAQLPGWSFYRRLRTKFGRLAS